MGVEEQGRKGCVPVLVGDEGTAMERVMLPIKLLSNPDIIELLKISADEFGYPQGLLKVLICRANSFKRLIEKIRSQEKRAKSQRVTRKPPPGGLSSRPLTPFFENFPSRRASSRPTSLSPSGHRAPPPAAVSLLCALLSLSFLASLSSAFSPLRSLLCTLLSLLSASSSSLVGSRISLPSQLLFAKLLDCSQVSLKVTRISFDDLLLCSIVFVVTVLELEDDPLGILLGELITNVELDHGCNKEVKEQWQKRIDLL
ncbi:hypothetical protein CJ030_MR0G015479 [Morella rubra]|uniref:Uncharacterized protein n=1 Tax=Morella rubra TaxID=262757 RepID=A0A6A1UHG6_9ROSI|nr:hypothetical protein CJ030_MR0G015479 [Morella rubra]